MKRAIFGTVLLFGLTAAGVASAGEGIVRGLESLPQAERAALARDVGLAKVSRKETFQQIDSIRSQMPKLDKTKRGRFALISPAFVALGKDAGAPLLERLVLGTDAHPDLSESAFTAWRMGIIEALGKLKEPRAVPALVAIAKGPETNQDLLRGTTLALARIGTDEAVHALLSLPAEKRAHALFALGDCRKELAATTLTSEMEKTKDEAIRRVIADALGRIGSSWAWSTPELAASGSGEKVRRAAALSLVRAAKSASDDLRSEIQVALAMVEHPETKQMIADAKKGATPDEVRSLDALKISF